MFKFKLRFLRTPRLPICFLFSIFYSLFSISASAQECGVVYVTPNGVSVGAAGTKTNPASLVYGLTLANPANKRIWLQSGTYTLSNPINIPSGVDLDGGYDINWQKSNGAASIILRNTSNIENNPSRLVAVYCNGVNNFRLQDLTIRVTNAFGNGTSTYGLYMNNCSNYKLVRCKVIAGNAGAGNNGTAGTPGMNGVGGTVGENGDEDGPCCRAGGAGGSGSFPGSFAGGQGGDGGERGEYYEWTADGATYPGYPGLNGAGLGGGFGGSGGIGIFTTIISLECDRSQANDGSPGANGADGTQGSYGMPGTDAFSGGYYTPGNGTTGDAGTHGYGGGGGGGGGSQGGLFYETIFNLIQNTNGSGAGGGGGGEGAQGAQGGTGGSGGGGSFAVYLNNNGAGGIIQDCSFQAGNGGIGGLGGQGGSGGLGGQGGGAGGTLNCDVGAGGNGGDGGNGGNGGVGGKGSDGVSYDLYQDPAGTTVTEMNVNSLLQPVVRVRYSGCTNAPVDFSTNATGTVQWYFGAGSTPTNFIGLTAQCSYSTQGRKTFTMVANGIAYTFTGFIDIFRNGPTALPNINSNSDSLCEGETGSFSASILADSYIWTVYNETDTQSVSGAAFQSFSNVPFDSAGTYTVVMNTYTQCCGISFPDTFTVVVDSIVMPIISIQSTAEDSVNTICDQTNVTFVATSDYVGLSPTYQWQVNGTNATGGTNSPAYTTSTLANGDAVTCIVTSNLACAVGEKDTSNAIVVTVIDIPQLTCAADSFVTDDPTYFNSQVVSGGLAPYTFNWDFGDQTQGTGDSVAHIYIADGTYMVNLEVTDANGCSSTCSTVVVTSSNLNAAFTASKFSGCSPFVVQFFNQSTNAVTYFWQFGDGTTSAAFEPQHIYNTPGTYDVNMWAFGGNGNDSVLVTSQIAVFPDPEANFQCFPSNITVAGDTVFFADNSSSAANSWSWSFGDGGTSTEQNPYHVYANNGSYDVTLVVTNIYGCKDSLTIPAFVYMNVGVNENNAVKDFTVINVYPVPFSANLNIEFYVPSSGQLDMYLEDVRGRKVEILYSGEALAGVHKMNHAFSSIESGVYLLRTNYAGQVFYHKLIANPK